MAWGLRTRDAAGNIIVDYTDRLMRVLGIVSSGTGAGSVSAPGFSQGTPFFVTVPKSGSFDNGTFIANVSISGTTLSWTNPYARDCFIIYGVY